MRASLPTLLTGRSGDAGGKIANCRERAVRLREDGRRSNVGFVDHNVGCTLDRWVFGQCPPQNTSVMVGNLKSSLFRLVLGSFPKFNTSHAAFSWRIHCGVEVTESSTNTQHTIDLSLSLSSRSLYSRALSLSPSASLSLCPCVTFILSSWGNSSLLQPVYFYFFILLFR